MKDLELDAESFDCLVRPARMLRDGIGFPIRDANNEIVSFVHIPGEFIYSACMELVSQSSIDNVYGHGGKLLSLYDYFFNGGAPVDDLYNGHLERYAAACSVLGMGLKTFDNVTSKNRYLTNQVEILVDGPHAQALEFYASVINEKEFWSKQLVQVVNDACLSLAKAGIAMDFMPENYHVHRLEMERSRQRTPVIMQA